MIRLGVNGREVRGWRAWVVVVAVVGVILTLWIAPPFMGFRVWW